MNKAITRRLLSFALSLAVVLGASSAASAAEKGTTVTRLRTPDSSGNVPFSVENMLPGDAETLDFTVKVSHRKPITLYFRADIRPGYEKLAQVLMVKVELPEKKLSLYDGLMRDMPSALEHKLDAKEKQVVYRITAYLDTSVGNDYQNRSLVADFRWWYAQEASSGGSSSSPKTGDDSHAGRYAALCVGGSLAILILLLRRRKEEENHE